MRKYILLFCYLLCSVILFAKNGKKVYADYHGVRYTRQYDGEFGRWEYYSNTEKSKSGIKSLCYNADLIDENGRHQIAAVAYPQTGIQSNRDPEFLEYQILSAKTAKIDGFFIEWGFKPHENDELLKNMQKVAAKYDFEIGVNWCDGWLYYDWITKIYPEINTREKKTEYMAEMFRYLVDSVFSVATAPLVNGTPVFYQFYGATPDEFKKVLEAVKIPKGVRQPVALRRWANGAKLNADGKYVPFTYDKTMELWKELGQVPTPWLPTRIRRDYPGWDVYANEEDVIEYMKPFRDSIWNSSDNYEIKSGFAMPGMDNRGCAGWGHSNFCYIPRNEGKTYEEMWKFCMAEKDSLDMMFIASWSDYTEGHEIEPTIENGDRELRTTLKYAAEFKEEKADERGLGLPLILFKLRKMSHFLEMCKIDMADFNNALDKAAMYISNERYSEADKLLLRLKKQSEEIQSSLHEENVSLHEDDLGIQGKECQKGYDVRETLAISLPRDLVKKLNENNYEGYICFEYLDEGKETIFVRSSTNRQPKNKFSVVARLRTDNTCQWKKAKIRLYKENIVNGFNRPTFYIKGNACLRNLFLEYNIYTKK